MINGNPALTCGDKKARFGNKSKNNFTYAFCDYPIKRKGKGKAWSKIRNKRWT